MSNLFCYFLLSVFLIPPIIFFSKKYNIEDFPDERKIHEEATPKLGGIAIFISYIISLYFINPFGDVVKYFLIAIFVVFILGICDDLKVLSAFIKIIVQLLATAFIIIFFYKVGLYSHLSLLQISIINICILGWFLFFTNAINLIDGIDGLLAGISIVILSSFAYLFFILGYSKMSLSIIILVLSVCGFWVFNIPKASIFMGDTGSLFIGFVISFLSIYYVFILKQFVAIYIIVSLGLIPIVDALYAIFRRLKNRTSPLVGDLDHFHHKLLKAGLEQNKVLIIFYIAQFFIVLFVFLCYCGNYLFIKALTLLVFFILYLYILLNIVKKLTFKEIKLIKPYPSEYVVLMFLDVSLVSYLFIPEELTLLMLIFLVLLYVYIFSFPRLKYLLNIYLIFLTLIIGNNPIVFFDRYVIIFILCMVLFLIWQSIRTSCIFIRRINCQDIMFISLFCLFCIYKQMSFYTFIFMFILSSIFYLINKRFLLLLP